MSIIRTIRRSLGINFDSDEEEELTDLVRAEELPAQPASEPTPSDTKAECTPECPDDDTLPADMLSAVVELFNSTQPEFVSKCLDTDAQKEYLLQNISADVAERMRQAVRRAHDMGLREWDDTRRRLVEEVETLRQQKEQLEQRREESKGERLSNQRQKRALTERVHDLEMQVTTLEAEKEQLSLENRSMVNRLRVAGLGEGAVDPQATAQMLDELEKLRKDNAEIDTLRLQLKELSEAKDKAEADSDARIAGLTESSAKAEQRAQAAENSLAEANGQIASLNSDLQQRDDIIRNLNLKLAEALREADRLAQKDVYDMSHLELTEIPDIIPLPEKEKKPTADSTETAEKKPRQKRGRRKRSEEKPPAKRFSAIDEMMDSTDWFDSTPPPRQEKNEKTDDDFGYKAPPKRTPPADDDKQLSLW